MSSIFDILGPIMVGPSSSHTAGAVRIGYTARQLFGEPVKKAEVYLHGSFAATGEGHGTENGVDKKMVMQAYSIGGGRIRVSVLDGIEVDFSGESNTLIVRNMDRPGCITEVSAALSREKINVATMQVFRHKRGGLAVMVVETDQSIPENVVAELKKKEDILEVISLNLEEGR